MDLTDVLTIVAIVVGPIIAVRVTRWLDDRNEIRNRRLSIYRTLMATRSANLSVSHVEALNSIDLEFNTKRRSDKDVRLAWKMYLDLLGDKNMPPSEWAVRRIDLLVELLERMGSALGYDFDKVHIKNGVYSPGAHGAIEEDQAEIRRGMRELLEGRRVIPIQVVAIPSPPEIESKP